MSISCLSQTIWEKRHLLTKSFSNLPLKTFKDYADQPEKRLSLGILNLINQRCLRFLSDLLFVCVDESMLPCDGRHSSKQKAKANQYVWLQSVGAGTK